MPQRSRHKGHKPIFDAEAARALLRAERLRLGLSQRDVATKANVANQTIVNVEHGNGSITVRKLEAVALALGLDLPTVVNRSLKKDLTALLIVTHAILWFEFDSLSAQWIQFTIPREPVTCPR